MAFLGITNLLRPFTAVLSALGIGGTAAVAAAVGVSVGADANVPNAEKPGVMTRSDDENSGAAVGPSGGGQDAGLARDRGRARSWWGRTMPTWLGGDSPDGIHRRNEIGRRRGGGGGAQQGANSAAVMDELKKAGLPPEGVAAVMGSAQQESTFRPDAANAGHTGLLQWDGTRWPKIEKWIRSQPGGDPMDIRWQAKAAIAEGRAKPGDALYDGPRTARGWQAVESSAGDLGKAMAGMSDIERFGPGEEGKRGAYARSWLPLVNGGSPNQTAGDVASVNGVGGVEQTQGRGGHTRNQPITEALRTQLAKAATDSGVNVQVYSGGQPSDGPGREGTHRHDNGRSADLRIYTTDPDGKRRYLDMRNEADRPTMEKFLRNSVKHGATGIGAGPGYMGGAENMHVGGGASNYWGANNSPANAPDWVRRAHEEGIKSRGQQSLAPAPAAPAPAAAKPAPLPPQASGASFAPTLAGIQSFRESTMWRGTGNGSGVAGMPDTGRRMAEAQLTRLSMAGGASNSTTTNDTRFNAPINIQTAATDADGIARDMEGALKRRNFAQSANYGAV